MLFVDRFKLFCIIPFSFLGYLFPKFVLTFRYYRWTRKLIRWNNPRNTQEYSLGLLFKKNTDITLLANLADKVKVREFVRDKIGSQYLTEMYGCWASADEIDFDLLPDSFVLKTNNGCASNIIVRGKNSIDIEKVKSKLDYWLRFPYGALTGQIHYSKIKPLILAENYLEQSKDKDILPFDYKFFCYKGKPLYILYYEGRKLNGHITPNMLYDMNWNPLNSEVNFPINHVVNKPISFEIMKACVTSLCADFEFVRVDFYEIDNHPVFGEMTFTPDILTNIREDFYPLMRLGCIS